MNSKNPKRVVVIGGGTGSFVILSGLKNYPVELAAVVTVTDSGGSSGRLRSEFGFLPVGDIRQCLAALASENKHDYIRQLLLYRFAKGRGLTGHNLGNLILTALTEMTGSEPKAIEVASQIFRLRGEVLPVSLNKVDLVASYEDGTQIIGEHQIDEPCHRGGKRLIKIATNKPAKIYTCVKQVLAQAEMVVLAPGDLYTSLLPNFIVKGVSEVLRQTKGSLVYIMNLMTRYAQTHGLTAADHLQEIEKYVGQRIDKILVNQTPIPSPILSLYEQEKAYPVIDDLGDDARVVRGDFLNRQLMQKPKGDQLHRALIRHHSQKVARKLISFLK